MSGDEDDPSRNTTEKLNVQVSIERLHQLQKLAGNSACSIEELAREFLENEIEAQHGLTFGPQLRRFIYR
jgi:hypothetical protein